MCVDCVRPLAGMLATVPDITVAPVAPPHSPVAPAQAMPDGFGPLPLTSRSGSPLPLLPTAELDVPAGPVDVAMLAPAVPSTRADALKSVEAIAMALSLRLGLMDPHQARACGLFLTDGGLANPELLRPRGRN